MKLVIFLTTEIEMVEESIERVIKLKSRKVAGKTQNKHNGHCNHSCSNQTRRNYHKHCNHNSRNDQQDLNHNHNLFTFIARVLQAWVLIYLVGAFKQLILRLRPCRRPLWQSWASLVAGLVAWQHSDQLAGVLACWVLLFVFCFTRSLCWSVR